MFSYTIGRGILRNGKNRKLEIKENRELVLPRGTTMPMAVHVTCPTHYSFKSKGHLPSQAPPDYHLPSYYCTHLLYRSAFFCVTVSEQ